MSASGIFSFALAGLVLLGLIGVPVSWWLEDRGARRDRERRRAGDAFRRGVAEACEAAANARDFAATVRAGHVETPEQYAARMDREGR